MQWNRCARVVIGACFVMALLLVQDRKYAADGRAIFVLLCALTVHAGRPRSRSSPLPSSRGPDSGKARIDPATLPASP